jgi:hypothetical protein
MTGEQFQFRADHVGDRHYFHLVFEKRPRLVPIMRAFIEGYTAEVVDDADLASRIALTVHELMENAMGYSSDEGSAKLEIEFWRDEGSQRVRVRSSNAASEANVKDVCSITDRLSQADVFAVYLEMFEEASRRQQGSKLGLARIAAEADMKICCSHANGRIEIVAENREARS